MSLGFRKNRKALDLYCDGPRSPGAKPVRHDNYCKALAAKYAEHDPLEYESVSIESRSVEYCSYIIEAVVTGRPFRIYGQCPQ